MGWSSGSSLFGEVMEIIKNSVVDDAIRREIYEGMIPAFEDCDCDTLDECLDIDPVFDKIYKEMYHVEDEHYEEDD